MDNSTTVGTPSEGGHKNNSGEHKKYVFFIEKVKHETDRTSLTVREILVDYGKVDPAKKTLALKNQGGFEELTDLDKVIDLKEGMHFVLFDKNPTPVS